MMIRPVFQSRFLCVIAAVGLIFCGCKKQPSGAAVELSDSQPESASVSWEFDDPQWRLSEAVGGSALIDNGQLNVDIQDGQVQLVFPAVEMTVPMRVQFRMKSGGGAFGEVEIHWRQSVNDSWKDTRMVKLPAVHDDQWHEFDAALPTTGTVAQIRIDPGYKPGKAAFDWVRIVPNTLSEPVAAQRIALPEGLVMRDATLEVQFLCRQMSFVITDKRTGRIWTSVGYEDKAILIGAVQKDAHTLLLTLWDLFTQSAYRCRVQLVENGVLGFELDADEAVYQMPFFTLNTFPPHLRTNFDSGKMIFCNRSGGLYVDQTDDHPEFQQMLVYGNLSLDMPWLGIVDEKSGEGLMVLVESPADAYLMMEKDEAGRNWPNIFWRPSLDTFRYPRRLSYRFSPSGGYVALAGMYRQYAAQTGKLVTLEEKARRKSNVERLKGAPMIWGAVDAWDFVREARTRGILRGVISNAHQGLRDTATLRQVNALGYITNEYDNVSDILDGPTGFLKGNIERAAYHYRPQAGSALGWKTENGPQYASRSSAMALAAAQTYVPNRLEKYGFNGRFLDVSAALDLFEDYHPDHTFDRRQDMVNRRGVFEYLNSLGVVLGTEHGNDWVIDLIEYCEGGASGPMWWNGGWKAGELKKPTTREQLTDDYLTYGMGYAARIPLWQLVYHDCVISTWYWGDSAGFMYEAAPELSNRKDLFNLLHGTVPLFWRDDWEYDWKKNRSRFLQTYHHTCKFNEAIAFDHLVNHEFLTADKSLQRTTFSSGTVCVVNFGPMPQPYQPDGAQEPMTLPPGGFYAKGPQIDQTRVMQDGYAVTRIVAEGYLRVQTERQQAVGPVELAGTITAFKLSEDRWHIVLENTEHCAVDLASLMKISADTPYLIYTVDTFGQLVKIADYQRADGRIVFTPTEPEAIYAVLLNPPIGQVWMTPNKPDLAGAEKIQLTALDASLAIRYTLDGSAPTAASPRYAEPFSIAAACTVKAQAFGADGAPAGGIAEQAYRVADLLYKSPTIQGSGTVYDVVADVATYPGLLLEIDQDGTAFGDYVDWGDAALADSAGVVTPLSAITPSRVVHDHFKVGINTRAAGDVAEDRPPILLGGKQYDSGIGMVAPGRIEYTFDRPYTQFTAKVGIDDSKQHKGRVIVRVYGIR